MAEVQSIENEAYTQERRQQPMYQEMSMHLPLKKENVLFSYILTI